MFASFLKSLCLCLLLAGIANADIVRDINYPNTPSNIEPYSASFDRAGFLIEVGYSFTFESISSTFGAGNSGVVTLEVFEGTPNEYTGTSDLTKLGWTTAMVTPGTIDFEFSSSIEFVATMEYFVGFKDLTGIGSNFKTQEITDERTKFFASPFGVTGEFRVAHGMTSPILRFSGSAVPEPNSLSMTWLLITLYGCRRRRNSVKIAC